MKGRVEQGSDIIHSFGKQGAGSKLADFLGISLSLRFPDNLGLNEMLSSFEGFRVGSSFDTVMSVLNSQA
jgi:hypothetical protein